MPTINLLTAQRENSLNQSETITGMELLLTQLSFSATCTSAVC